MTASAMAGSVPAIAAIATAGDVPWLLQLARDPAPAVRAEAMTAAAQHAGRRQAVGLCLSATGDSATFERQAHHQLYNDREPGELWCGNYGGGGGGGGLDKSKIAKNILQTNQTCSLVQVSAQT